jgi:hypothetical protein
MDPNEPENVEVQMNKALLTASKMKAQGRDLEYIYNELNHLGFQQEVVNRVMNALNDQRKEVVKKERGLELVLGAIILFIGLAVTIGSIILLSPSGGYIFAFGAIITGIVLLIRGWKKRM